MPYLEDELGDIIKKARTGLGLDYAELSDKTKLSIEKLEKLEAYEYRPAKEEIIHLADCLHLNYEALHAIARGTYQPQVVVPQGVLHLEADFSGYPVNAYLVYDSDSREGMLFDTGADPLLCEKYIRENEISLQAIAITHGHGDHVGRLSELTEKYNVPVYGRVAERTAGAIQFSIGALSVRLIETPGHTHDSVSYLVDGSIAPLAVVGDLLFAGSIGASGESYKQTLIALKKIMALSAETVILPGHGPITSVDLETKHNPFHT